MLVVLVGEPHLKHQSILYQENCEHLDVNVGHNYIHILLNQLSKLLDSS
jgi:hypothetical protein